MTRTPMSLHHHLVFLLLASLLTSVISNDTAHARQWTEALATAERAAHLKQRLGLDASQVDALIGKMSFGYSGLGIRLTEVVEERRPDGSRNIFALYFEDERVDECIHERRRCGPIAFARDMTLELMFVRVLADGSVARVTTTDAFGFRNIPVRLALVTPEPGAAAVPVIEGYRFVPGEHDEFEPTPAYWFHVLFLWNGQSQPIEGVDHILHMVGIMAELGVNDSEDDDEDNDRRGLGTVSFPDAFGIPTITGVACNSRCRCRIPRNIDASKREVARMMKTARACTVDATPLAIPTDFRLVENDAAGVEGRAPARGFLDTAAALAKLTGLSSRTAGAWLTMLGYAAGFDSGIIFESVVSAELPNGGRSFAVVARDHAFATCVERLPPTAREDGAAACRGSTKAGWHVLMADVDANQRIVKEEARVFRTVPPERITRILPDLWWVEEGITALKGATTGSVGHIRMAYALKIGSEPFHVLLMRLSAPCCDDVLNEQHVVWTQFVKEGPADPYVLLHGIPCNDTCPCFEAPRDSTAARDLVESRRLHPIAQCRTSTANPFVPRDDAATP